MTKEERIKIGYCNIHTFLIKNHGNATKCENPRCQFKNPKRFEWALKKGKIYSKNIKDYIQLCPSCHRKYDETPERRENLSKSLTGRKLSKLHRERVALSNKDKSKKSIHQLSLDGVKVREWSSVNDAAAHFGIVPSGISNCLTKVSKSAAGFKWAYKHLQETSSLK